MSNSYNLTNIRPELYEWDEDGKYVQTNGKRHVLGGDGFTLTVTPVRVDSTPMNFGCKIDISCKEGNIANFTLDSLTMNLLIEVLSAVNLEQFAARYVRDVE